MSLSDLVPDLELNLWSDFRELFYRLREIRGRCIVILRPVVALA